MINIKQLLKEVESTIQNIRRAGKDIEQGRQPNSILFFRRPIFCNGWDSL